MNGWTGKVGVIGMGIMGQGILQALVEQGIGVTGISRQLDGHEDILAMLTKATRMAVRRKRTEAEKVEQGMAALSLQTELSTINDSSLVIEAIPEEYHLKVELLTVLAELPGEFSVATNTSSLSVQRLATDSGLGKRLIGLHFMNPVPGSKLVEVVGQGKGEAESRGIALVEAMGLTPVVVEDSPGFVVNRLLMPMIAEAARLLDSGVADAMSIDTAMRLGCAHPMGPLALADMIGLDVVMRELEQFDHELGPRYAVPENLRQLVADGHIGRKSGQGFHRYGG